MSDTDFVTRIEVAAVQTQMGEYNDVAVEIYNSWVKIEDDPGVHWIPRDKVTEVFDGE
ncbi:hypothetical protein [Halohasta litorea]|uniref:Uncharacterized protein n=1 Tax=Halohasta litorea TaxID=869891 RepID=A0ABD6D4T4_9EURY|nr:hypothetical protein [Halohasta litorea]